MGQSVYYDQPVHQKWKQLESRVLDERNSITKLQMDYLPPDYLCLYIKLYLSNKLPRMAKRWYVKRPEGCHAWMVPTHLCGMRLEK